ncbi:unnamed protein product [Paramecium sonneborni]|uniref:Uncharacterized protein n=1 Tax=Paramecium sonneborni TaxID=65129 RepID=A0A8S1RI00_9CILI|nr:unnamed protein product [Paramecium sonneborni]
MEQGSKRIQLIRQLMSFKRNSLLIKERIDYIRIELIKLEEPKQKKTVLQFNLFGSGWQFINSQNSFRYCINESNQGCKYFIKLLSQQRSFKIIQMRRFENFKRSMNNLIIISISNLKNSERQRKFLSVETIGFYYKDKKIFFKGNKKEWAKKNSLKIRKNIFTYKSQLNTILEDTYKQKELMMIMNKVL